MPFSTVYSGDGQDRTIQNKDYVTGVAIVQNLKKGVGKRMQMAWH